MPRVVRFGLDGWKHRAGCSINSRQPAARASAQACSPVGGGGADTLRSARACGDTLCRCKSRRGERDLDAGIHQSVVDGQRKRATDGKPVGVAARPDPQHEIERAVAEARQYCKWLVLSMPAVRWRASRGSATSPGVQARCHVGVSAMLHCLRRIPDRWLKRHCTSTSAILVHLNSVDEHQMPLSTK